MNQKLQEIFNIILQSDIIDAEQKDKLLKAVKDADKELEITAFKLERTEKVKKTTAILLEETIEELEQKRKAVEEQNRELEIEASLERVRSQAMGMKIADDILNICKVLFDELVGLGYNHIRNSLISIFNDNKNFFLDYDYSDSLGKSIIKISYDSHPLIEDFMMQIRKATDAFVEIIIDKNQLDSWKDFRRSNGEADDPRLDNIDFLYYYIFSIGSGSIGISTFQQITAEQLVVLKRFRNVFKLSYQRYKDIEQAETQAREAQIEAALEKVRSRSLAMHSANELGEVVKVIVEKLKDLGVVLDANGIVLCTYFKDSKDVLHWIVSPDFSFAGSYLLPYFDHPIFNSAWESKLSGAEYFSKAYTIKEKNSFFEYSFEHSDYKHFPDEFKQWVFQNDKHILSFAWQKNSAILIPSHTGVVPTEDDVAILKRFAKVFEQSYVRFLDLQKAEAQAREAQIETALERVRSRSMGMQKSEELKEVIQVVYEQFVQLNIQTEHTGFILDYKARDDFNCWIADRFGSPSQITIPYFDCIYYNRFNEAKKNGIDFFATVLTLEEKNRFYSDLFKHIPGFPEESKKIIFSHEGFTISTVLLENVALYIENFSGIPYSDAENAILMRFGKVFQQTYTRFLDLQKAEEQAREAKIEASLEKVRSVALSLKKSDEMLEIAQVLYEQLIELGFSNIRNAIIDIKNGDEDTFTDYDYSHEMSGTITQMSYHDDPTLEGQFKKMATTTNDFFELVLEGKELEDLVNMRLKNGEAEDPRLISVDLLTYNLYSFGNGAIGISNFGLLSEKEKSILNRFSNVFTFAYKRYNDLALAEERAREAKIEAALERVRAKTMAMHKSDELADTAAVVFQQLINLGIEPNRIYITIIKDEKGTCEFWITDEDGSKVSSVFKANLNQNTSFKKMYLGWQKKSRSITIDMQGEELQEYFKHLTSLNVPFKGGLTQKRRLQYIAYFSNGFIGVASPNETKPETSELLERFAAVFNLTYTRFNDLEQAEAQNKIIQAENNRKSKELEDARQLQLSMLPKELPQIPHLDIAVYMKTATEVGGDYYDLNIDKNGTLTFILGDATGHGMMSGMMVSIMKSFFISNKNNIELKHFFENSNNSIKDMHLGRLMMALMGVQVTSENIIATNAGMPSLIYFRNKSQKAGEFVSNNLPLGGMKNTNYSLKQIRYEKDDTLLLMSDGFAELKNEKDEHYGYDKVKEEFRSVAHKNPNEIVEHLKSSAAKWINGIEPDDDVTFVVIKVK